MPPMLTTEEMDLLDMLAGVYNAFRRLPEQHGSDMAEVVLHVRALQEKVATRLAVRAHPEIFGR